MPDYNLVGARLCRGMLLSAMPIPHSTANVPASLKDVTDITTSWPGGELEEILLMKMKHTMKTS